MNRLTLMKTHALLAAFILPVAIMFGVTGSLYTWGIKGNYSNEVHSIELREPLKPDASSLTKLAQSQLEVLNIPTPEGKPKLKIYGSHFLLEWTGSSKDLILEPGDNPQTAKLTVKHTNWYRNFVQLHKAKGGTAFKVYAAVFAIVLGLLLISGFMMAWLTPKLRVATLASSGIGFIAFISFFLLS